MYDTLTYTKKLIELGVPTEKAEAGIKLISEMIVDNVATRQDIEIVRSDMRYLRTDLRAEISQVRSELKSDIAEVHSELKSDIAQVRSDMKLGMVQLEHKLTLHLGTMFGAMFALSTTITIGVLSWVLR